MQNKTRTFSIDQLPILTSSTAAREAITEDARPQHVGEFHSTVLRAGSGSSRGSSTSVESDTPDCVKTLSERPMPIQRAQPSYRRSTVASPITKTSSEHFQRHLAEFFIGSSRKKFRIDAIMLMEWSPYFAAIENAQDNRQSSSVPIGPFHFPELDVFAFGLLERWFHFDDLDGPHDFHSMNHYLELYIMAGKFQIEALKNSVMDLIRQYYRRGNMTAPAFRLVFVYAQTKGPCLMREFLVTTAAYRALTEAEDHSYGISNSVKGTLANGGDLAQDYANALCHLAKSSIEDVREGDPCRWHEHKASPRCKSCSFLEALDSCQP